MTRFWHGFTAHYNTYFNGTQAYIEGSLAKENGNKDNYTELLPLYTVGNKSSKELGKSNFETAITKCKKAIQLHSIKAKPEWNKERKKTEKELEWLSRKEYNPFIWKAWMLMGRSQFHQGNFDEAASTFAYMSRLFKTQPAIYGKGRAWLAKCYVESDFLYDAEDIIRNMERDSIHWKAQKEWDYTYCDYYLHAGNMPKAAEYLRKVIKHEMRSKQRAREYYLLGQIEAAQGHKAEAYRAFRKTVAQNPPYELEFNARISMTEVLAEGQAKKMIGRLKRMARNENNAEYLDQVYYAIGNIYLAEKDTANAISAYEKGNEKAKRTGIEKGVLLLHLGDLYWQLEKYSDAKRCYGSAIGMLDKERPDYEQLSKRSKVLDELVPFTDAIQLQDSLQELAKMDEKDRNAAIDRVIDALKKKEKEEQAKAAEEELEKRQQQYGTNNKSKTQTPTVPTMPNKPGQTTWYFYNPTAVIQGKQTFERTWGKRENADNWQRNNKTVVGGIGEDAAALENLTDEQRDSIAAVEKKQEEEEAKMDSAVNDPHKREYYMAQIPFTEEAVEASNTIIKEGLVKTGIIFKDKLDNLALSEKQFNRLLSQYPEFEPKDEVYYHLFLLHSRKGQHDVAQTYVDSLKSACPDSKWTILLTDPYYADNAKFGKHIEDSIYGATYEAFKADRFKEVYGNADISAKRFPLGDNRDRFIFLDGLTRLNDGDADSCVKAMEIIVKDYPSSVVAEMAGMIVKGVQSGKQLRGAKFDLSNVWDRRNVVMADADSVASREFSAERNTDFLFLMAYAPDSINENQLLYQLARYNFTSFLVRNFDITIEDSYGMHHMVVTGFRNFDEARQYGKVLMAQEGVKKAMGKARPIIISNENIPLIGTKYSYNDYDEFYVKNFAPLLPRNPEQLYDQVNTAAAAEKNEDNVSEPMKVSLPTEEVAPGGAKPVEPQKPAEEEDLKDSEELMDVPADTEIALPQEGMEIEQPQNHKTEEPQNRTEDDFNIPATTEPTKTTPAEDEFEVPTAKEPENTTPAEDEFEVPAAKEPEKTTPAEDEFEVPAAKEPEKNTPAEDEFEIPTDDADSSKANEDEIVFEEDGDKGNNDSDDAEEISVEDNRQSTDELEDEYYELDGF